MARVQHKGKVAAPVEVSGIRVLKRNELSVLAEPRPANSIQTLRDTHHRIARAVAAGLRADEICALSGYSNTRVSMLRNDPAFMELVAHYRGLITAEYVREADPVIEYLKTNALKAAAMLSDKLDDAMEKNEFLPTRDLTVIAELGFDRTGYGKVNKNLNVNVDFAAQLEAARKRSATVREARVIEALPTPPGPQSVPDGSPTALRRPVPPPPLRRL